VFFFFFHFLTHLESLFLFHDYRDENIIAFFGGISSSPAIFKLKSTNNFRRFNH